MQRKILALALSCSLGFPLSGYAAEPLSGKAQVESYSQIVYKNYKAAYNDAVSLQKAIDAFLATPDDATLASAKQAWLTARDSYGQTEAFRFYEGPIDFVDDAKGLEGPEGRLNSWPLNEAYIDYVQGNEKAGIINDSTIPITKESLTEKNQEEDETDVSTGYHAVEFLLWGQDLDRNGPGVRPASDYKPGAQATDRRRAYLKASTGLLVDDLKFLVDSWEPGKDNYAQTFIAGEPKESLSHIFTALATLSGFELSAERMATALDSGDQEDEHSCFSDNTHKDFIANAKGISNVYFGHYGDYQGASLDALLREKDAKLADELTAQLKKTEQLVAAIPHPIDREVLSSPEDSKGRQTMEAAIVSLQQQAKLFVKAGEALGLKVQVMSD